AKGRMTFTRDELANFVRFLGAVRAEMPPPSPPADYSDLKRSPASTIMDPRWWTVFDSTETGSLITIDHPFGHVKLFIARESVRLLLRYLTIQLNGMDAKVAKNGQ